MAIFQLYVFFFLLSIFPVKSTIIHADCPESLMNVSSCGYIRVPVDRQRPQRGSTSFHFAKFSSKHSVSTKSAFIFLTGGPGGGIVANLPPAALRLMLMLESTRDALIVDYRGTGRSDALNCPSAQDSINPFFRSAEDSTRCITEIGPAVIHYNSEAISHDIDALREQFGYRTLDLYGASYGTVVLQHYAALFPARVRTAVLDCPVPLAQDQYRVRERHILDRIYSKKGINIPKLQQDIAKVLRYIRGRNPKGVRTISVEQLHLMYSFAIPGFDQALSVAAKSMNFKPLEQLLRNATGQFSPPIAAEVFSIAASYSIPCNDFVHRMPFAAGDPPDIRHMKLERALAQLPRSTYFPFRIDEASLSRFWLYPCSGFPFKQNQPPILAEPTSINALTLYGELDANTPIEYKSDLLPVYRRLVVKVPDTGHVVLLESACGTQLIVEFVTTGKLSNRTLCS